jgi:hypothetical protein
MDLIKAKNYLNVGLFLNFFDILYIKQNRALRKVRRWGDNINGQDDITGFDGMISRLFAQSSRF